MSIELNNVFIFLGTLVLGLLMWIAKWLFDRTQSHETRIQAIENIQGTKLDALEKKIDKIEFNQEKQTEQIEILAKNIHKEKNQENVLNNTLMLIYKHLEKQEK